MKGHACAPRSRHQAQVIKDLAASVEFPLCCRARVGLFGLDKAGRRSLDYAVCRKRLVPDLRDALSFANEIQIKTETDVFMAIPATQIRRGMVILFEGQLCKVVDFRHHTPGNLRAMVQTKLRNLRTGSSFDHRFRSADTVERASLEQHEMEYLYSDGSHHHFMNTENYEQTSLSEEELGDAAAWLMPGLKIQAEFYEGAPIGIDLPPSMELTVTSTEPTMKGATVSNVNKPATLENGVTIQVPPFVNEGDRIRVDPSEGRYIERAK
jgi:elongation factor P